MKKKKTSLGQAGLASSKDKQSQARAAEDWEEAWLLQILQQDPNWASPVKRGVGPQLQSLSTVHSPGLTKSLPNTLRANWERLHRGLEDNAPSEGALT